MAEIKDNEYRCYWCQGIFGLVRDETWNSERAASEYERTFNKRFDINKVDVICHDCWVKLRSFGIIPSDVKSQ